MIFIHFFVAFFLLLFQQLKLDVLVFVDLRLKNSTS